MWCLNHGLRCILIQWRRQWDKAPSNNQDSYFAIWLRSEGLSVIDRNLFPTGTSLIPAACVMIWGFFFRLYRDPFYVAHNTIGEVSTPALCLSLAFVLTKKWCRNYLAGECAAQRIRLPHCKYPARDRRVVSYIIQASECPIKWCTDLNHDVTVTLRPTNCVSAITKNEPS